MISLNIDRLREHLARDRREGTITALLSRGGSITVTYRGILGMVDALCARLEAAGMRRGQRIGIKASNSLEWLVWDLAVCFSGGQVIAFPEALEASAPQIIDQHQLALLVMEEGWGESPHVSSISLAIGEEALCVDAAAPVFEFGDCYTRIFSSGTSGYLKGLEISKQGTNTLISELAQAFRISSTDRQIIFLPLSNYQQRMLLYLSLLTSGDVCLSDIKRVHPDIREFQPTFLIAPPAFYESVLNLGRGFQRGMNGVLGERIRFLITGMAPARPAMIQAYWTAGLPLCEVYGVVECGMVSWNTPDDVRIGTVGRVIDGVQIQWRDDEIVIRRNHPLTLAYFECQAGDSEATFVAEKTVATGDVGGIDEDGFLTITGRKKEVVITAGGMKFQPAVVESLIVASSIVKDAALISTADSRSLKAVVCTEVINDEVVAQVAKHIAHINETLPSHQRVGEFVLTGCFSDTNGTLTRNLKKNRIAIQSIFGSQQGFRCSS